MQSIRVSETPSAAAPDAAALMAYLPLGLYVFGLIAGDEEETLVLLHGNEAARRLTGVDPASSRGAALQVIFPELARQGVVRSLLRAARTGQPFSAPDVRLDRGDERFYSLRAFALPGTRLGVVLEDVTEARRIEDALLRMSWAHEALLLATDDGIVGLGPDGRVSFANPAASRMLAVANDDLLGLDFGALVGPAADPAAAERLVRARAARTACAIDRLELRRADGSALPVALGANPLPDGGAVLTFRDISAALAVRAELIDARETAEAASRAKGMFLANMSHELRTPLNAIIGYAEMLRDDAADGLADAAQTGRDLGRILQASRHLLGLIDDVLDLAKIEAGRLEICKEAVAIVPLLSEVCHTVEPLVSKGGNRLEITVGEGARALLADELRVRQVLLNLLSNASKFTSGGLITVAAELHTRLGRPGVALRVSDEGIGMDAGQVGRLFSDFTQGDASTTRRFGGTGLGLSLSRHLCRLMEGDITCESAPGRGSVFEVWLPAT